MKLKVAILGSTGSIGKSLLNVISKNKDKFLISLLTSNKNYKKLYKQSSLFNVKNLIISDATYYKKAKYYFKNKNIKLFPNITSYLNKNKKKIDIALIGISGLEGLEPTLKIIPFTKNLASANKESLICGWQFIDNKLNKFNSLRRSLFKNSNLQTKENKYKKCYKSS